ncbi:hypothetical protein B0H13DRAFT_2362186 [Mycena leptocephala]|nr:hypothetical protein B0H13DRAFT_2362186 [Mycena leptocephala]
MPSPAHPPTDSLHPHTPSIFLLVPRLRRFPQSAPLPTNACPLHIADHAALRDNVLFGRPFEEERRYRRGRIIEHSCLLPDLRSRADGDLTERPKVIDLSASEYRPRRVLQCGRRRNEDPLSAVDANVGKALFCTAIPSLVSFYQMFLRIGSNVNFVDFFRGSGLEEFALLPLFLPTIPHDFRRWDDSTGVMEFFWCANYYDTGFELHLTKCRANFVARLLVSPSPVQLGVLVVRPEVSPSVPGSVSTPKLLGRSLNPLYVSPSLNPVPHNGILNPMSHMTFLTLLWKGALPPSQTSPFLRIAHGKIIW